MVLITNTAGGITGRPAVHTHSQTQTQVHIFTHAHRDTHMVTQIGKSRSNDLFLVDFKRSPLGSESCLGTYTLPHKISAVSKQKKLNSFAKILNMKIKFKFYHNQKHCMTLPQRLTTRQKDRL